MNVIVEDEDQSRQFDSLESIPESLKNLTDLEKQLIVKNLIFLKIRQLPKTRMAAVNDR